MTDKEEREKATDLLDNLVGMIEDSQGNDYDFALKKGIEALKQEDVLDKIRAEIEQFKADCDLSCSDTNCMTCNNITFGSIFRIIDKYKAEMESEQ